MFNKEIPESLFEFEYSEKIFDYMDYWDDLSKRICVSKHKPDLIFMNARTSMLLACIRHRLNLGNPNYGGGRIDKIFTRLLWHSSRN